MTFTVNVSSEHPADQNCRISKLKAITLIKVKVKDLHLFSYSRKVRIIEKRSPIPKKIL